MSSIIYSGIRYILYKAFFFTTNYQIYTSTVRLGTSFVPTYPHQPMVLAQQALALHDIAPDRLRLGYGSSHRVIIEDIYGLPQTAHLAHLREYVSAACRTLGREGQSSRTVL